MYWNWQPAKKAVAKEESSDDDSSDDSSEEEPKNSTVLTAVVPKMGKVVAKKESSSEDESSDDDSSDDEEEAKVSFYNLSTDESEPLPFLRDNNMISFKIFTGVTKHSAPQHNDMFPGRNEIYTVIFHHLPSGIRRRVCGLQYIGMYLTLCTTRVFVAVVDGWLSFRFTSLRRKRRRLPRKKRATTTPRKKTLTILMRKRSLRLPPRKATTMRNPRPRKTPMMMTRTWVFCSLSCGGFNTCYGNVWFLLGRCYSDNTIIVLVSIYCSFHRLGQAFVYAWSFFFEGSFKWTLPFRWALEYDGKSRNGCPSFVR